MSVELIKVKEADDGMRLNRWFLKYYPNLTLGRLQKLLRTKQIKVDGKRAEASLKLAAGQEVRIPPKRRRSRGGKKRRTGAEGNRFHPQSGNFQRRQRDRDQQAFGAGRAGRHQHAFSCRRAA